MFYSMYSLDAAIESQSVTRPTTPNLDDSELNTLG